jgi:hypothetical protein
MAKVYRNSTCYIIKLKCFNCLYKLLNFVLGSGYIYIYTNNIHFLKNLYEFYWSLLKSIDLINLENACEYFATKSLLVVGQFPPPVLIWCNKVFLCLSSILQSYIRCSFDWVPSFQAHIGLSINLNLCRYDFFPWPETITVNFSVISIFKSSLCSTVRKNDLQSTPF